MRTVYQIRKIGTNLYSTGGGDPRFTKVGKTWTNRRNLNCHLALVFAWKRLSPYKDCEIVVIEVEEKQIATIPLMSYR